MTALASSQLLDLTERYLSPLGQQLIFDSLTRATGRAELSALTLFVFLWATLRVFRGLDVAFSILYGTDGQKGILDQSKDGLIVLFAMSVAVAGSVVLHVSLSGKAELYGVIGAVLLIITWLYFGALILLLGATVNVVLGRRPSASRRVT